jgi:uncharacterized damage-inducible protein DinB
MVEPWLRGTLTEFDAVRRQVLHALQLAGEDVESWCAGLTEEQLQAKPAGVAPVVFHLRHMARSLDRLLTYAEGNELSPAQLDALAAELAPGADGLVEFRTGLQVAMERVKAIAPESFQERRFVGRHRLATTVGGLLVHCAEHTQRHVGQVIITAKIVMTPFEMAHSDF